jgi:hypothetical protein
MQTRFATVAPATVQGRGAPRWDLLVGVCGFPYVQGYTNLENLRTGLRAARLGSDHNGDGLYASTLAMLCKFHTLARAPACVRATSIS